VLPPNHQNAGQNQDIYIANRSFENMAQFRYLGMTVTDQNFIQKEIKKRLNSSSACNLSVQKLLSAHLLSKCTKIGIYETIFLLVILYGCETWSLTLRVEHRWMEFENRVLRLFGPERDEVTGGGRKLHNEELITCTLLQV
jgi:hypothetical protein